MKMLEYKRIRVYGGKDNWGIIYLNQGYLL